MWEAVEKIFFSIFWKGNYSFFDYKYNIQDYHGQDYDGSARYFYMIFTLVSVAVLVILLRNIQHKKIDVYLKCIAIIMPVLEIVKISWESYYDVTTGRGFNVEGLLPLYTCSFFMVSAIGAAFLKGKVRDWCVTWLTTIGFVGGMSNVLFIRGLNWYPFFTFGAFYSMTFHYIMVFTAMLLVVSGYKKYEYKDILTGFIPHLAYSALVIPVNSIWGWDYMQYNHAGGVPLIEGVADKLNGMGMMWLTVIMMIGVYFALHTVLLMIYKYVGMGCSAIKKALAERKARC